MSYQLFAMDTAFYHSLGSYEFEARCEMLRKLGYDATYLTLWSNRAWRDLPLLVEVKARYGLAVAGVYVTLDISAPDTDEGNQKILQLVNSLEGCSSVEINVKAGESGFSKSDPRGDRVALTWLEKLLSVAESRNVNLLLYPHINCWLERIEDAVRLCQKINHPLLGVVFPGFHWYAVSGQNLQNLEQAAPYLRSVNLCGSRKVVGSGPPATIEPLDTGELDNFVVLGFLRQVGYSGMIGIQGYSVGGDVYTKLKRSVKTFRDMEQQLKEHPKWAELRWGK